MLPASAQHRIMRVLLLSQVLGGIGVGSGVSVVGLLAFQLSGREALSGLSSTAATMGTALIAIPMARLATAHGRRLGLTLGYAVGAAGAVLAVAAAMAGSFALHVVASLLFGAAGASNLQARFAATDLETADKRARSLSLIIWATTIGAVLGPNLTGPGQSFARMVGLPDLAGAYVFSFVVFACAAAVQFVGLRPDPLLLAREVHANITGAAASPLNSRQAWALIRSRADVTLAVSAISAAHAVMVGVMVMTPVHMKHDGAELRVVGLTISLHIAGMYAFSPLVARVLRAVGERSTIVAGFAQFVLASLLVANSDAQGSVAFMSGMVFLGLAWSFCLVSGSALLVDSLSLDERPAVQGVNDLVMNLAGGAAGVAAGVVLAVAGYPGLAHAALLALLIPAAVLVRARVRAA